MCSLAIPIKIKIDQRKGQMKCKPVGAGEWVQPIMKGYLMQCCDWRKGNEPKALKL